MIRVEGVTKKYPARLAVDRISFSVDPGEIVGFLGPNGAGKTTTMRMLAGYLPMTSGRISVAGYDVSIDPQEVRRRIGYLPESCPLYPEMRVDEYLYFRAELKGVKLSARKSRVSEVKEQCGLEEVGKRIIGQLSKGFRQRVGLADSLVHDPDLLILDEPTVGLDPNQIRQVRSLVKDLAKRHTILLSTHILPEVEAICERILILNAGQIVAADTVDNLRRELHMGMRVDMEIRAPAEALLEQLSTLPGLEVRRTEEMPEGWIHLELDTKGEDMRETLFELAVKKGWPLRELVEREHSLEDTFLKVTKNTEVTL
jgi:ABC-2 type transport system ATP-binding protein